MGSIFRVLEHQVDTLVESMQASAFGSSESKVVGQHQAVNTFTTA
jgi:hypothetical protein